MKLVIVGEGGARWVKGHLRSVAKKEASWSFLCIFLIFLVIGHKYQGAKLFFTSIGQVNKPRRETGVFFQNY